MKADIHPKWYPNAKVNCSCGNTFNIGSTKEEITVEICSSCHPFFTGEMRFLDTAGRVQKFQERQESASQTKYVKKKDRKLQKKLQEEKAEEARPKSFKEMLDRK